MFSLFKYPNIGVQIICRFLLFFFYQVKVPFDANKLYASEILSILLQNEPENRYVDFSEIFIVVVWYFVKIYFIYSPIQILPPELFF